MANFQQEHNAKIVEELSKNPKLRFDKLWRMNNLYWIITRSGTKEVFKMNRAQLDFFTKYLNTKNPFYRHIILKARQLGFTTFIDIFILDEILFNTNKEGLIIAHKVEDAREIFDRKIDFALRNMADEIKDAMFKLQRNSAKKIQVIIDYGAQAGSTSSVQVSVSGRSGSYHYVHVSEFAKLCVMFPKRADEVETGTFPAVAFDGYIFIESTAEGMAGRFYEMYQEGSLYRDKMTPQLSRVRFMSHFYNWQWDDMEMAKITEIIPTSQMEPAGDIDWEEYRIEHDLTEKEITYYYMKWLQLGKNSNKLRQEFPTTAEEAFLSTGAAYFPTPKVQLMMQGAKRGMRGELVRDEKGKLKFEPTPQGRIELLRTPEQGEPIVIGGDTAEGLAHGDAQVLYAISAKFKDCMAVFHSQEPPDEFIGSAYDFGEFFGWAMLAVEVNKDGLWVNNQLEARGYPNLYYRKQFDDITQNLTKFYGWKTTSATRPFLLAALKSVFLSKKDGFPLSILKEMLTFVRNMKGKPEAMSGKHDDTIMAAGIAYAVLQEVGQKLESTMPAAQSHMKMIFGEVS